MDLGTFTAQANNAATVENESNIGTPGLHETHGAVGHPKRRRLDGENRGTIEEDEENEVNEIVSRTSNMKR
jgi:hypothetical protein